MLGRKEPVCGTLHSGICSPDGTADASPGPGGSGFSSSRRALQHGGWARKPGAELQVLTLHVSFGLGSGDMAAPGPALCLFDVDGTLTAPRQVGGALRAGGGGCRVARGPRTGPATTQGGHRGAAEDRPPAEGRGWAGKLLRGRNLSPGGKCSSGRTVSPRFGPARCPPTAMCLLILSPVGRAPHPDVENRFLGRTGRAESPLLLLTPVPLTSEPQHLCSMGTYLRHKGFVRVE